MKCDPTLVVNPLSPHQGSVLGLCVEAEDPRLGEICKLITLCRTLKRACADVRVELAAIRAARRETLFSFTVGNDIEPSSGKTALEILCETMQRIQWLNRRIKSLTEHNRNCDDETYERSQRFRIFLIRTAGIKEGDVAASKAMGPVELLHLEAPGSDYLIRSLGSSSPKSAEEQRAIDTELRRLNQDRGFLPFSRKSDPFTEIPRRATKRTKQEIDKLQYYRFVPLHRADVAKEWIAQVQYVPFGPIEHQKSGQPISIIDWLNHELSKEPLPRTVTGSLTNEEYAARHKNDESVTVPHLPNFCASCSMWVTPLHDHAKCATSRKWEIRTVPRVCKSETDRGEKFYSWLLDLAILESRGDVTEEKRKKIEKHLKDKYGYRVRKSISRRDDVCPPQEFKCVSPKEQLL